MCPSKVPFALPFAMKALGTPNANEKAPSHPAKAPPDTVGKSWTYLGPSCRRFVLVTIHHDAVRRRLSTGGV